MTMTATQLQAATGCSPQSAGLWLEAINAACEQYQINTPYRMAAFLGQVGVESDALTAVVENLNYSAAGLLSTFPTHFDADLAASYARQPVKIANRVYASRMGNGDEASGDGWVFRGRGLIQITGRANYTSCGEAIGMDLVNAPQLLEIPSAAAMSAGWYWFAHGCNALADAGKLQGVTRAINGGLNGYARRLALYGAGVKALA